MNRIIGMAVLATSFVASTSFAENQSSLSMKPVGQGGMVEGPIAGDNDCLIVAPTTLVNGVPIVRTGNNTNAPNQCANYANGHTWEAFRIGPQCWRVKLEYCGSTWTGGGPFGNAWLVANGPIIPGDGELCTLCKQSDVATFNTTDCVDGNVTMTWAELRPGDYYYPVMFDPTTNAGGNYTLRITGTDLGFCNILPPVPTVTTWGLIVMGLLLLIVGTVVIRRRHATAQLAGA